MPLKKNEYWAIKDDRTDVLVDLTVIKKDLLRFYKLKHIIKVKITEIKK